jgi:type IV pilus assembly protein PilE
MNTNNSMKKHLKSAGITLIELLVVIAMLAVLLVLAVPSYRDYVVRANRSEALDILLTTAACQERVYTRIYRYDAARCDSAATTMNGYYTVSMATSNANQNFTLTATPQNGQVNDSCGNMTLTDAGVRGSSKTTDVKKIADCWRGKKI